MAEIVQELINVLNGSIELTIAGISVDDSKALIECILVDIAQIDFCFSSFCISIICNLFR